LNHLTVAEGVSFIAGSSYPLHLSQMGTTVILSDEGCEFAVALIMALGD
jgi:hypothetical protein